MNNKKINWLGYTLISVYVLVYLVFLYFYFQIKNNDLQSIMASLSALYLIALIVVIPYTLKKTWYRILPERSSPAMLIDRAVYKRSTFANGGTTISYHYWLIFELPNGTRMSFPKEKKNETIALYEKGILTYKEHGKKLLFVRFDCQK